MASTNTSAKKTSKPAATKSTAKASTTKSTPKVETKRVDLGSVKLPEIDFRAMVTDYAYATLGASDLAIETFRELPQRLETQRKERAERAAALVKEAPARIQAEVTESVENARKEFDTYATRGRKVVESINKSPQTKRAMDQTETARAQVKGAVTSLRKVVEQSQEAFEGAVRRLGQNRSA